jgi:hypothetical protein
MKNIYFAILLVSIILSAGCSKSVLKQSFNGSMSVIEGNKVIYEYCQGCHVHRNLSPDDHVIITSKKYSSEVYKRAKECRTCHSIDENFWGDISRRTLFPYQIPDNQKISLK